MRDVSEALLCDLEKRWSENIVIEDISDIILAHAQNHFGVYVKYCSNKIHQDRLLNNLKCVWASHSSLIIVNKDNLTIQTIFT